MVRPRLKRNRKLGRELGIEQSSPVWLNVNGVFQPMFTLKVDARKLRSLVAYVARGLFCHHIGRPLSSDFAPDVSMWKPMSEPALWASLAEYFPPESFRCVADLGRGSFIYEGAQSIVHPDFSVWRMSWHGVRLHGRESPPEGIGTWWAITKPTPAALSVSGKSADC